MITKTIELKNFNPAYANNIDFSASGVMFSYNDPIIQGRDGSIAPEDIIITVGRSEIALHIIFSNNEEPEQRFFLMSCEAGNDLMEWVGANAFGLSGDILHDWVKNMICVLCFTPSDGGGIILSDIPGEDRRAMFQGYSSK